ncbi:MAG: hypothetical protein ACE366_09980 [Bradymonadia bacterium]
MFASSPWLMCALIGLSLCLGACEDKVSNGGSSTEPLPARDASPRRPADAQVDAAPPPCRINSDCDPGFYCDTESRICIFDCRTDRDCEAGLTCQSGQCLPPVEECVDDDGCDPPASICAVGRCGPGCLTEGCAQGLECSPVTGRCIAPTTPDAEVPPEDCREGAPCPAGWTCNPNTGDCVPPAPDDCRDGLMCGANERCDQNTGRCVPADPNDCRQSGVCPDGWMCDQNTGDCNPPGPPPMGSLGDDCQTDDECNSGLCLQVAVAGDPQSVCAQLCCASFECPPNFGCLYLNGVKYCLPDRIFPPGVEFTSNAGQTCGPTGNSCRSGLCDVGDDQCQGGCCTDVDCGGRICTWRNVNGGQRMMCDVPLGIGFGRTGDDCSQFLELDCLGGICIFADNRAQCADPCCSARDCPNGYQCNQVLSGVDNRSITTACAPLPRGELPFGSECVSGAGQACQSGLCVEDRCVEPCCSTEDCPAGSVCLPRDNGEGGNVRVCVQPEPPPEP